MLALIALSLFSVTAKGSELTSRCLTLTSPHLKAIKTDSAIANEVVLFPDKFSEKDVKTLGYALHAFAIKEGDSWRISRDADTRKALEKDTNQWLHQRMTSVIQRTRALQSRKIGIEGPFPFQVFQSTHQRLVRSGTPDRGTSGMEASEATPAAFFLADLLEGVAQDRHYLGSPGRTVLFSSAPLPGEQSLPQVPNALEKYITGQNALAIWADEAREKGKILEGAEWLFPTKRLLDGERTVQLQIGWREYSPVFYLQCFDQSGVMESGGSLQDNAYAGLALKHYVSKCLGEQPLSQQAIQSLGSYAKGSPKLGAAFVDPVAHEPLDTCTEGLRLLAKARGCNSMIGCIPDGMLKQVYGCVRNGKINLDELERRIIELDCELVPFNGSLVIRPVHPLIEEAFRVDRRPLSQLAQTAAHGKFDLDALLAYHNAYMWSYTTRPFLSMIESNIDDVYGLSKDPNWSVPHEVLATLGCLQPSDWQQVQRGEPVSLGNEQFRDGLFLLAGMIDPYNVFATRTLESSPFRVSVLPSNQHLEAKFGSRTLLRRISRGYAERTIHHSMSHTEEVIKGNNIPFDYMDVSIEYLAHLSGYPNDYDKAYQSLDRDYLFQWKTESTLECVFYLNSNKHLGPYTLRKKEGQSTVAVPLKDVPGIPVPAIR